MKTSIISLRLLIALFVAVGLVPPAAPALAAGHDLLGLNVLPLNTSAFGYSFQELSPQWNEINGSGTIVFGEVEGADDKLVPVTLGFEFPFFEHEYSQVSFSTNGFLVFDISSAVTDAYPTNTSLPLEFPPNNIIAGFWDDLIVGKGYNLGSMYYQRKGISPNQEMVFEWYRVTRYGSAEELNFQIVLHESGAIDLNYGALTGVLNQSTIGIEDADGIDGLYLFSDSDGLGSDKTFHTDYPFESYRVKAGPVYQGAFLVDGKVDLPLTVVNTGLLADTFHFHSDPPDLDVQIIDGAKNPLLHTPLLQYGDALQVFIRVVVSDTVIGQTFQGKITVVSDSDTLLHGDLAKSFEVEYQAAVPAPFTTFYVDSTAGYLRHITPQIQVVRRIFSGFSGSTFALSNPRKSNYLASWEASLDNSSSSNIVKIGIGATSGILSPLVYLEDHQSSTVTIRDSNPVTAVAPDGTTGLAFLRSVFNNNTFDPKWNSNIFFSRLNSSGDLISPNPVNLTNNTMFLTNLLYTSPVISSAGAATFVIAYGKNTRDGQLIYRDIEAVKVDLAGNVLQHLAITDSKTDGKDFNTPVVAQMQNDDVFLAYHAQWAEDALEYNQIHYTVIHPQASAVDEPSVLDVNGKSLYVTPFTNGNILLAWIQTDALGIAYQIFDPTGVPQAGVWPKAFNGVMGREIKNISMTGEINGNVVITWIDQWGYYLSYALMAQDGSLVTPPMTFLRGSDPVSPNILVSNTGRGVAQLENMLTWQVFMPAVKRQ